MIGWNFQLNGQEFERTQGDSEGQGSLACFSPWGHKESDMANTFTSLLIRTQVLLKDINEEEVI